MPKTAYVNFRTDQELKEKAEKIYAEFGFGLGDAINLFLRRSVMVGGCPFDLRLPGYSSGEDTQAEEKIAVDPSELSPQKKETRETISRQIIFGNGEDIDDEAEEDDEDEWDSDPASEGFELLNPNDPQEKLAIAFLKAQGIVTESPAGDGSLNQKVWRRGDEVRVEESIVKSIIGEAPQQAVASELTPSAKKPGRNDPCWCGSGKKYKKCHGR